MTGTINPMWWVLNKETEETIAICDKKAIADEISEMFKDVKGIECVVRVAYTR